MLQVYHVGHFDPELPNGVDRVIHNLGRLLEGDIGFHVVGFTEADPGAHTERTDGRVRIHGFGRPGLRNFRLPAGFRRWLPTLPDSAVLHLHSVFAPLNFAIARECRRAGIPYVFTPHDSYVPASLRTRALAKRLYLALFERRVLDGAAALHALTAEGKECIARHTANRRIRLIRNFIPTPPEPPCPPEARDGLLYLGRMDRFQKGIDRLLAAYAAVRRECPAAPVLTLAGPADAVERPALDALMAAEGLTDAEVVRRDRVEEAEKHRLLAGTRFYVQLSRFEGFGLSVAEALALSVPVVVSREIPLAPLVESHGAGLVVDGDAAAPGLLRALGAGPGDYAAMVEGARRLYRAELSADSIRPRMLGLYHEAAAAGRAARLPLPQPG